MEITIQNLIDDIRCYEAVRDLRWPEKIACPHCRSDNVIKRGKDDTEPHKQRYECKKCCKRFDDLTNTVFAGHHQPLKIWVIFLYFMGLNLSTEQIAKELNVNKGDAHYMAGVLRSGVVEKKPPVKLSGEVECDEVYVVAGHKGNPAAVKKGTFRQAKSFARRERTRHVRKRKAPNFWHDTTIRRSIYSDACKC
jgi:transposase-like protein